MHCEDCAYKNNCNRRKEDNMLSGCTSGKPPNVVTNSDRIRSMTNLELAKFIDSIETDNVSHSFICIGNDEVEHTVKKIQEWLESVVAE